MKRLKKYLIAIIVILFSAIIVLTFENISDNSKVFETTNGTVIGQNNLKDNDDFLATLKAAGINNACKEMGVDFKAVFAPLASRINHPYRQYRWSVSRDEQDKPVIHALPPEEEMGWTPWERWSMNENIPVRTAWILYPVKEPIKRGISRWYKLEESEDLMPRLQQKPENLENLLRLARIDVVADWLKMDFKGVFIDPLKSTDQQIYAQYRWVVIPHILAADGPVIYALPPVDKSDDWPWESWYTDEKTPIIHHVHYTKKKPNTTGSWTEGQGAPQRPPEIFGHMWYWYDDSEMMPALSNH